MSSQIEYLDFELTIGKAEDNRHLVNAKFGKDSAQIYFNNPFNEDKRNLIKAEIKANLRSSRKVRSVSGASEVKTLKSWGTQLFDLAMSDQIGRFYEKCKAQAEKDGKGIRWRLALDSSVDDLPWEFLCNEGEFLALNPFSPVVRYMPRKARLAPLRESEHPLRILVVIASPEDEIPLDTEAEKDRIVRAFESLTAQGLVKVSFIEGPDTWQQLYDTLFQNETHILHFIGHGAYDEDKQEGVLVMEDAEGKSNRVASEGLSVLVQGRSRLRLVVLNSCLGTQGDDSQPFSSVATGLIRSGIPAVVAMQAEISDDAAREIADTFYKSLVLNMPVDAALTEARRKIFLFDLASLEWATPILYMQVADGQLFQFKPRAEPLPEPPSEPPSEPETIQAIAALVRSDSGHETSLGAKSIRIGRGTGNDIKLDEQGVSRKHAVLVRGAATYTIENFGRGGTLVNDEPIDKPMTLKDNDLITVGSTTFTFRLLADFVRDLQKATATGSRQARTTTTPVENLSLEDHAAARYREGEQFMARGNWPEAIRAFNSAHMYVPNYRDVGQKLSVCERRQKVASLYDQAKTHYAARNYDQALQSLSEARCLDPHLIDSDDIGELSEIGQKYLQAIAELQRGNKEGGAALLREIITRRPDFEDAARSFEDLVKGGSGLISTPPKKPADWLNAGKEWGKEFGKEVWDWFGSKTAPAPTPTPGALVPVQTAGTAAVEATSTRGYSWRTYEIVDVDLEEIAEEIRQYFYAQGYESQAVEHVGTWAVQGRKAGLVRLIGMGKAATIVIERAGAGMKVSIGGGQWLEKGAVLVAAGILTGGLTFITSTIGMVQQQQLMDDLWQVTENVVKKKGGRQLAFG